MNTFEMFCIKAPDKSPFMVIKISYLGQIVHSTEKCHVMSTTCSIALILQTLRCFRHGKMHNALFVSTTINSLGVVGFGKCYLSPWVRLLWVLVKTGYRVYKMQQKVGDCLWSQFNVDNPLKKKEEFIVIMAAYRADLCCPWSIFT